MIRRWRAGGLIAWALPPLLLAAACTSVDRTSSTTAAAATSTQPPATSAPNTAAATTTSTIDAAAVLGDAIGATGNRYRYTSTVESGEVVLATIDGVVSGTGFTAMIDAGDTPVEYRKTDDGEWVRQGDGDWTPLGGVSAPASEPLATLAAPISATFVSDDGSHAILHAVFPGAAMGASAEQVTVRVTITGSVVSLIEYESALGDGSVRVATAISDIGAVGPIASP